MTIHLNTAVQHSTAYASVGLMISGTVFHYLPTISLILSTVAATLSIVTMISGALNAFANHRAKIRAEIEAEKVKAQAKIAAETVRAQAQVVAKALDIQKEKTDGV